MRPPRRQAGGPRRRRRGAIPRETRATARPGAWRRTITSAISAAPMVRVRFAPSPTGYLHIGGARTALFNWLWARKNKGVFVLRVGDTDQSRRTPGSVVRFRMPDEGATTFTDLVKGEITTQHKELQDEVILRADGVPLYNFGAVIDDIEMEISMVARGDDHVVNTPRQILMYQALRYPVPQFAHLPMILGADKQRLSKRHGAVNVLQYRDDGYLPGALVNYLARLGWSHGDQEIFTIPELIEDFDWEHVGANAGVFNPQKLEWVNQQWIKRTPPAEIAKAAGVSPEFAALMQERARNLNEIREAYRAYIVPDLPAYDEKAVAKQLTKETRPLLEEARAVIDRTFEHGPQAMEQAFRALAEQRGLGLGKLAQPVRLAVTGTTVSPPLFETIALLGKARTLRRIDAALERIK